MRNINNWDEISTGENKPLPVGVYGLKIVDANDYDAEEYLEIKVDIVSKENKEFDHYFSRIANNDTKNWPRQGTMRLYYRDKALSLFKSRIVAIERSNAGYSFEKSNFNEKTLVGKYVMGIFQKREFVSTKDGEVKTTIELSALRSTLNYKDETERQKMEKTANTLITLESQHKERPTAPKPEPTSGSFTEPAPAPKSAGRWIDDDDDLPF